MSEQDFDLTIPPRLKISEEVAGRLREGLLSGRFEPGQRLTLDELSRKFGVSSMPIREALISLANEGLLEVLPRRGFRVARQYPEDTADVFMLRGFLAGVLAGRAAAAITPEQLSELDEIQEQIETHIAGKDSAEHFFEIDELNYRFHKMIASIGHGERLRWYLNATDRNMPKRIFESIPGWLEMTKKDHRAILNALRRHDAEAAERLARQHSERAGQMIVDATRSTATKGSGRTPARRATRRRAGT